MHSSVADWLQSLIVNAPQEYSPTPRNRRSASAVAEADRKQEREEPERALSQSGKGGLISAEPS